jgi:hypothetical protein
MKQPRGYQVVLADVLPERRVRLRGCVAERFAVREGTAEVAMLKSGG